KNCPELEDPAVRLALTEYAAFLHLWRNPPGDGDDWIGFTSYRQLAKTPFRFWSKWQIRWALWRHDGVGWGFHGVRRHQEGPWRGAAAQAEKEHPGIMAFLAILAEKFEFEIPERFCTDRFVLFASYWVLPKKLFSAYMDWSWPIVAWCLAHRNDYDFLRNPLPRQVLDHERLSSSNQGKNLGYVVERLFILWYINSNLKIKRIGPPPRF
ncbi:MAG: hypothetical protein Q8O00_04155, partial [Holophaga sp.]|nr:hypothetical protein [Holophaga sp.]